MRRFILGLVVVLFAAGSAAAVDLQPGDLISESRAVGAYSSAGPSNPTALTRFDRDTGATEIISGCSDADCNTVIGSGPIGSNIDGIAILSRHEVWVTTTGSFQNVPEGDPLAQCDNAEFWCRGLISVDPITGDRTVISAAASFSDNNGTQIMTILVGSGRALSNGHLAIVPPDPDPISAGLPGLTGWGIAILVGFLLGASYMKGKYDGRVAA